MKRSTSTTAATVAFVMTLARGMGYAILQRDDDSSAPVVEAKPDGHYALQITDMRAKLAELDRMSPEEGFERHRVERKKELNWRREEVQRKRELRERYTRVLAELEAWQPDPLIESTKEYALKCLRDSIEWDCGPEGEELRYHTMSKVYANGSDYIDAQRRQVLADIANAEKHQREDQERTEERNRHIRALYASLPPAAEATG